MTWGVIFIGTLILLFLVYYKQNKEHFNINRNYIILNIYNYIIYILKLFLTINYIINENIRTYCLYILLLYHYVILFTIFS